MSVSGEIGPVEVVSIREWTSRDGQRSGRNLKFRQPGTSDAAMELPIARGVEQLPPPGEIVNLVLEVYPWHDARLSADGRPFSVVDTKNRVVGAKKAA